MSHESVSAASALAPQILAARTETEERRQLPEALIAALVEAQLFRLALPTDLGGGEVSPLVALQVYEELAKAEASVAWLVWNSSLPCLFGRYLADTARAEVFGDKSWKYASSTRPTGRGVSDNGGYLVSGRWSLVSGCMHADWLGLMYVVEKDGEVEITEAGGPHMRMAFVPSSSVEIVDTWHVGGLRGTGSHDVVAAGLKVPHERTFNPMDPIQMDRPIGRVPIACTMSAGHAAICLGIASGALDTVVALGRTKVSVDPVPQLPDRASNQFLVAEAGTKIAALRHQLNDALGSLWAKAESGTDWTMEDIGDVWSAAVTTARECRSLVTALCEVAGTPSLYVDSPLERSHRDIHAALKHVIAQRFWVEEAGRVRFGMDPTNPLYGL